MGSFDCSGSKSRLEELYRATYVHVIGLGVEDDFFIEYSSEFTKQTYHES